MSGMEAFLEVAHATRMITSGDHTRLKPTPNRRSESGGTLVGYERTLAAPSRGQTHPPPLRCRALDNGESGQMTQNSLPSGSAITAWSSKPSGGSEGA